jgi:hypothetical protein
MLVGRARSGKLEGSRRKCHFTATTGLLSARYLTAVCVLEFYSAAAAFFGLPAHSLHRTAVPLLPGILRERLELVRVAGAAKEAWRRDPPRLRADGWLVG